VIAPTGPERGAFPMTKLGANPANVVPLTGSCGIGLSMTIGV